MNTIFEYKRKQAMSFSGHSFHGMYINYSYFPLTFVKCISIAVTSSIRSSATFSLEPEYQEMTIHVSESNPFSLL